MFVYVIPSFNPAISWASETPPPNANVLKLNVFMYVPEVIPGNPANGSTTAAFAFAAAQQWMWAAAAGADKPVNVRSTVNRSPVSVYVTKPVPVDAFAGTCAAPLNVAV